MNRIYGIRRDRRAPWKYGRAAVMTAVLAPPMGLGSGIAVTLTLLATGLFAAYVNLGHSFGSTYGPLGGTDPGRPHRAEVPG